MTNPTQPKNKFKLDEKNAAAQTDTFNQAPSLPQVGYVRLPQILAVYPVSASTWWEGVRAGRFPQPVKLGPRISAWRVEDIRTLIDQQCSQWRDD